MDNEFQKRWAYDSNGRLEYRGSAEPGSLDSEEKWRIRKYSWSGINETSRKYPNGTHANIFIWDNRESYTYS